MDADEIIPTGTVGVAAEVLVRRIAPAILDGGVTARTGEQLPLQLAVARFRALGTTTQDVSTTGAIEVANDEEVAAGTEGVRIRRVTRRPGAAAVEGAAVAGAGFPLHGAVGLEVAEDQVI